MEQSIRHKTAMILETVLVIKLQTQCLLNDNHSLSRSEHKQMQNFVLQFGQGHRSDRTVITIIERVVWAYNMNTIVKAAAKIVISLISNECLISGASPRIWQGGWPRIFFSDLEICMSRSDMLRMAKPCALLGGFGGVHPREIFLKWCNLVRFGVYFDHILSLKNFKNYHF